MRKQLADKYLKGSGIEIGGLHNCLPVAPGVDVTYVDRMSLDNLNETSDVKPAQNKIVVDDAEFLSNFEERSLDFIIANHVLEHCHDPIGTLICWRHKLKEGGIAYIALPDKEQSFDQPRPTTTLRHMIDDHLHGSRAGDIQHYSEWHYHIDKLRGLELESRVELDVLNRANIHFHVFDIETMRMLFDCVHPQFETVESVRNGAEVIWILKARLTEIREHLGSGRDASTI